MQLTEVRKQIIEIRKIIVIKNQTSKPAFTTPQVPVIPTQMDVTPTKPTRVNNCGQTTKLFGTCTYSTPV